MKDDSFSDSVIELAHLCQEAAAAVRQHGTQLSAPDFSYLGSSTWQSAYVLAERWGTQPLKTALTALVAATIDAVQQAPAMQAAGINN